MRTYDKIKQIADKKNLSIYRIEKDLGIGNGTIGKWNDVRPSSFTLMKVARHLGVQVEELLDISDSGEEEEQ